MKLLANPAFLASVMLFITAGMAFAIGVYLIRRMRKELLGTNETAPRADSAAFAMQAYNAVIQQLKQKENELQKLRQTATERASASENISAAVLNHLASGVVLFNTNGLVQQANPSAKSLLGFGTAAGLHARDLFRGASAVRSEASEPPPATLTSAIEICLKENRVFRRLETDYTTPAGESRVLGITISPVAGNAGERLGAACLITDLTQVSELSRQLRMRESLAAMGEMSAGMAHEFKNSLATIAGYSQMLGEENTPETIREFANRIRSETTSLTRTVTEFLNITRPQKMVSQEVSMVPLLKSCAADCGVELQASQVAPELTVIGDPAALRQCFLNLLRNSAEAGNGKTVHVTCRAGQDRGRAWIELADDAGGIDPALLSRIFIPFVSGKANGNGLGLSLAQRIVSDHGGTILARNEGAGAIFTLSFPTQISAKTGIE
ncbi:MAG: two-component system sensor histidine kinase NtrB [Terriglobales bacterium]